MSAPGIARRRLLLSTARKLLRKKSLPDISMIDLAQAAKIPKGSAYFFYDSIDAVWSALAVEMYEELEQALRLPVQEDLQSWSELFRAILQTGIAHIDGDL